MKMDVGEYKLLAQMGAQLRIEVDGIDVTDNCFAFDTDEGWADCYVRDDQGRIKAVNRTPASERMTGLVTVVNLGKLVIQ